MKEGKMSIYDWYKKFDGPDDHVAAAVLSAFDVEGEAFDMLLPVVANDVLQWRRNTARAVEQSTPIKGTVGESANESRAALLKSGFSVGGKRWVLWGEATVDDHRDRIAFLQKHIAGVIATIAKHEAAIEVIESTPKAKTLNDVERLTKKVAA